MDIFTEFSSTSSALQPPVLSDRCTDQRNENNTRGRVLTDAFALNAPSLAVVVVLLLLLCWSYSKRERHREAQRDTQRESSRQPGPRGCG